jgi:hypothetical protein
MDKLSTTQFLILLSVNIIALMLIGNHYFNIPVRVDTKVETKDIVHEKEKIVNKCDKTTVYTQLLTAITDACAKGNKSLAKFSIDDTDRPKFECQ